MSKINREEWTKLIKLDSLDVNKVKKANLEKFLGSFIILAIYIVSAYLLNLTYDIYVSLALMTFCLIDSVLAKIATTVEQQLNILQFAKIVSLTPLGIAAILNWDAESIRFSFIFAFLYFVYIYDYYRWNKKQFLFLYIYALAFVPFIKEAIIFKIILFLVISFITYIARNNILLRDENKKLFHVEQSFKVFQSHSNLLEHYILNSITKLYYYKLQLDSINHPEVTPLAEEISNEISYIEKVITETKGEDLHQFNYQERK